MKNIELLSKVCSVAGAPGHEKKIRDFIIGEIKKEGLGFKLDNLGNLIVKIKLNPNVINLVFDNKYFLINI